MTAGAAPAAGVALMRPAKSKPSISGMWRRAAPAERRAAGRSPLEQPPAPRGRCRPRPAPCPSFAASPRGCAGWSRCRRPPAPAGRAAPARSADAGRLSLLPSPKRVGEVKRAALARLALHPDAAAHQLDELRRDRQPQPGAAVLPRRGAVGLVKASKISLLLVRRNADAGVADQEMQSHRLRPSAYRVSRRTHHLARAR